VFRDLSIPTRVSYKVDGWNTQADYAYGKAIKVATRGRTGGSIDANGIINCIPNNIPETGNVRVYMESSIPNAEWRRFALESNNTSQRASVSTAIAQGLWDYLKPVAFGFDCDNPAEYPDKYQTLKGWGFSTPYFMTVNNYKGLLKAIEIMGARRGSYTLRTDGLVIENAKIQVAVRVGAYQESLLESYVTGYEGKRGVYGDTIIALIKQVRTESSKHDRVNCTNLQCAWEYDLQPGYPIAFNLRSDAYPTLDKTRTIDLHKLWAGRFDEFREMIDERQAEVKQ
jgi:hypothetical protein